MIKLVQAIILGLAVMSMLSGCSGAQPALEKAKAASNPGEALAIIRTAISATCESRPIHCAVPTELQDAERAYFADAARVGDGKVLRELFEADGQGWLDLKDELKPSLLQKAKSSKDPDLLAASAAAVGNDRYGVVNLSQQMDFLERAWAAGDERSAGRLAHLFVRMHDYSQAYLWSLRCVRSCDRGLGVQIGENIKQIELRVLETRLDGQQIATLQKDASRQPAAN